MNNWAHFAAWLCSRVGVPETIAVRYADSLDEAGQFYTRRYFGVKGFFAMESLDDHLADDFE